MKRQYSLISIIFIFAFILSVFSYYHLWKKNRIVIDAPSYYTYLPATFVYHDLQLNFIDKDPEFFRDKIWYYKIEGGKKLIKHPIGISVVLSPFFLMGHLTAKITGGSQDGYSLCYQNAASIGVLVYLLIGLLYLRKLLRNRFSDKIIALTLSAITLGTNLLWYSSFEGLMPHAISFSLLCVCLYHFYEWLKTGSGKNIFWFAVMFGFSILIRPLALTLLIYFLIVAIDSKGGLKGFIDYLKQQRGKIVPAMCIVILIVSLQLMYWKYATGHWIYDVYIDEHFVFSSPQMLLFLFSFRKGVFVYTPILIFSIVGLVNLYRKNRSVFYGTIVIMPVTVFLLSSWWAWSYGICWGMRPLIDYYSILGIPLASGFSFVLSRGKIVKIISATLIAALIFLNLFQTWQYKNGLIHYDDMTREAYFKGFFQTKASWQWQDLLSPYDWSRRIKGLPQIEYSKKYIEDNLGKKRVFLRAYNMEYLAVNSRAQNTMAAYFKNYSPSECELSASVLKDGTITLSTNDGHFLSVRKEFDNAVLAVADSAGSYERFEITYLSEDGNKVALKSVATRKYLGIDPALHNILFSKSDAVSQKEIFRLFIIEPEP